MRWIFRLINTHVFDHSVMERLFKLLHVRGHDVQGHVTNSLQVKILLYVWKEREIKHF